MNLVLKIFKIFLIWRIALFLPIIAGSLLLNYGSSYPFFEISYYKDLPDFLNLPVFTTWSNFDGVHYLNIAVDGYKTEARFFPLFPLLIFLFGLGNISFTLTFLIAVLLPSIFLFIALIVFYKLLKLDYPEKTSIAAICYLLIFPTAFFFASIYTESLFLLLLLTSFYFARKGNWILAFLSGMLLISTRFVGIFIIPALIYEYVLQNKILKTKNLLQLAALVFITPVGLVAYSIYNLQKWGNSLYFLSAQGELGNSRSARSLILPPQTLYRYFKILTNLSVAQFEWWLAFIEVAAFIFGCVMLYIALKKKVRISYLVFGALAFLLPSLSGTFSGLPRYLLIVFPIFITLGVTKLKIIKIYFLSSIILLLIFFMFFSRGYFIS